MTDPPRKGRPTAADVEAALRGLLHTPAGRDWSVHPGELLREALEQHDLSQTLFAIDTGYTLKHVNRVVRGVVPMSTEFADRCEQVLGLPAIVLVRMQADWDLWAYRNNQPGGRR